MRITIDINPPNKKLEIPQFDPYNWNSEGWGSQSHLKIFEILWNGIDSLTEDLRPMNIGRKRGSNEELIRHSQSIETIAPDGYHNCPITVDDTAYVIIARRLWYNPDLSYPCCGINTNYGMEPNPKRGCL